MVRIPKKRGGVGRLLTSLVSMFFGCALVMSLVILMNSQNEPPKKEQISAKEMMAAPKKKKKKRRPKQRPKPQRKTLKSRSKPAPVPQLSTALSGMSFGLPTVSGMDLKSMTDKVLGDEAVTDSVMNAASVDERPRPMEQSRPVYPARARSKNIEGYVVLSMLIDKDGRVDGLKVLESEPPGVFDEAAMAAVEGWVFAPAKYKGMPVAMRATQRIPFKIGN